jgi:hypothetical protein
MGQNDGNVMRRGHPIFERALAAATSSPARLMVRLLVKHEGEQKSAPVLLMQPRPRV